MRKKLAEFYAEDMYEGDDRTVDSARILVPMVVALLHPKSIVDVGCGRGAWLREMNALGVKILGLDGDYLKPSMLRFPHEFFRPTDLSSKFEIPPGDYDLAICLETAEHLPPANSRHLVRELTKVAPRVLFSAAPPGQLARGHINCQPLSYWRRIFEEFGFRMIDPFRPRIRDDQRVGWWYRQNTVLFATREAIAANAELAKYPEVERGLESEWVYIWVADAQASGPAIRARRLTRRVLNRASKALRFK